MIKSEKALSEVVGMVMILSIVMVSIGSIMVVGVPMIESSRNRAKMDVAEDTFLSLQNDIEEVVRGPIWVKDPHNIDNINEIGPSRVTEFELMGGTLSVLPNITNLTGNDIRIMIPPSNITYAAENEVIAYENGAVIRKYESGIPLMISKPLITIYNNGSDITVVSIHAILLNGTLSSAGGDGRAWVETRLKYYNQTIEPADSANSNQVDINITSRYPEAWEVFFNKTLNETAGLKYSRSCPGYYFNETATSLAVKIYGKDCNKKDIFLSVYESRLDVKVR